MSTKFVDEMIEKARELGLDYGKARGSWVIDGNSPKEFCQKIIDGYEDGDPEIMDISGSPLSGEFADGPTESSVLRSLDVEIADHCNMCQEEQTEIIDAYEHAYQEGFWDTVIQAAYAQHGDYEPCGICKLYGHKAKDHD